jgi:asparagine synthase (glutamine-hydrolysing)
MCGICVTWSPTKQENFDQQLDTLGPRGPDSTTKCTVNIFGSTCYIGFTRLQIQGDPGPEQPFLNSERIVLCNGEIFNADALVETLGLKLPKGSSDCAVIPAMLDLDMPLTEVSRQLDGDFAIVVVNLDTGRIDVSRDPYGVRPLYYVCTEDSYSLVSELKAAPPNATDIQVILPGHVYTFDVPTGDHKKVQWHQVPWLKNPGLTEGVKASQALKVALEAAVEKRLTTVRDLGACLSGGLDSSLVAAIAAKFMAAKGLKLHTYSIGMVDSPDLKHARLVAEHIGSIHHERIITAADCVVAVPDVIYGVETCDITSVRASVGNFLLGRFIAEVTPTVKVVLNGDGADEALGGYLYMRSAPTDVAFETETDRLLTEIHMYDVARSERSMAAHGLESRSPFLDRQFISVARSIPTGLLRSYAGPSEKSMEKAVLRSAFTEGLLPSTVLWRRKEAFSDGISAQGTSWFHLAKEQGEKEQDPGYTINPPKTAEALWYRNLFVAYFSDLATIPAMWMPRFVKATDPSARTLVDYKTS